MPNNKTIEIPEELELDYSLFLDQSTILYGASKSGKSKFIIDILFHLKNKISQIIVISPSEQSNGTYTKTGTVAPPLVHYSLNEQLLITLWKRQEMLSAVYNRANKPEALRALFNRLDLSQKIRDLINGINEIREKKKEEIEEQFIDKATQKKQIEEIDMKYQELLTVIYKVHIAKYKDKLKEFNLSPDERFSLKYLNFNPRMVLIFDDCSAQFKKIKTPAGKATLGDIFYRGRHVYLSVVIAVHDDKLLDSEWRKNSFVNVFTTPHAAHAYFKHDSNGFSRETLKRVSEWLPHVFQGFQKLIYIRERDKFYRCTAKLHDDFQFGSECVRYYCKKIESNGVVIDKSNQFYGYFCQDFDTDNRQR